MASKNNAVFSRLTFKLPTRQEGDGHEIQVEVREDEEQSVKLQEIIDLLVAAGYFRARIKGLSSFDKVVGGMTWCIESCSVDLDVDLLFKENSTIGQKIALTEKIVAVLPKLQCPHHIEPHQIQGLDFIHIFPLIQWLVKRSMEFRENMSQFLQSYAVNQFNKNNSSPNMNIKKQKQMLENLNTIKEVYRPCRSFRRKNVPPSDIESRVQITLLEYGHRGSKQTAPNSVSLDEDATENLGIDEHQIQHLLSNMTITNEEAFDYDDLNEEERKKLVKHYESLHLEFKDGGEQSEKSKKIFVIQENKRQFYEKNVQLDNERKTIDDKVEKINGLLKEIRLKQSEADKALKDLESSETELGNRKEIEDLVIQNDNLRTQEIQFREHCKGELGRLQSLIQEIKNVKTPDDNNVEIKDLEEETEKVRILRLHLAKKNRSVAALQRQLDDVPSHAELTQYQRRFLELYNQVSAKHKETKQYYTLYNTLEDTRLYMKKELSLLNSISDSYPEAMQSYQGREEFLEQFERILEGVNQSKLKLEKKLLEEKRKRDQLSYALQGLIEQQRKFVAAVRQLRIEYRKYEALSKNRT